MPKTEKQNTEHVFDDALLAASGDTALAAVSTAGSGAEALVAAWIKAGNAEAVNEVAERGAGSIRKAARRGINVLKSRGVPIPVRRMVASVAIIGSTCLGSSR